MVRLFLFQAIWIPSLVGFGLLVSCGLSRIVAPSDPESLGEAGLLGIVALDSFAMIGNFFFPLSAPLSLALLGVGYALLVWRAIRGGLPGSWREILLLTALAALTAFHSSLIDLEYDAGLYHLPVTLWSMKGAWPIGLANLHLWYGTNCSWFALNALLGLPGVGFMGAFFSGSLLVSLTFSALLLRGHRHREAAFLAPLFAIVMLMVVLLHGEMIPFQVGRDCSDLPVFCYGLYCFYLIVEEFEERGNGTRRALLILFAVFAGTVKLTAGPILLGALVAVFVSLWREHGPLSALVRSPIFRSLGAVLVASFALLSVPWLIRGFLASGCFLFPLKRTCVFPLPWAVREAWVDYYNEVVRLELAGTHYEGVVHSRNVHLMLALALSGITLIVVARLRKGRDGRGRGGFWSVLLIAVSGLWFCLRVADVTRYFAIYLVALTGIALTYGVYRMGWQRLALDRRVATIACLGLGAVLWHRARYYSGAYLPWATWPPLPKPDYVERTLGTGQVAVQPVLPSRGCWDLPQPCSCYLDENLQLRQTSLGRAVFSLPTIGSPPPR